MKHIKLMTGVVLLALMALVVVAFAAPGPQGNLPFGPQVGGQRGPGPQARAGGPWAGAQGMQGMAGRFQRTQPRTVVMILKRANLDEAGLKKLLRVVEKYDKDTLKFRKELREADSREKKAKLLEKFKKENAKTTAVVAKILTSGNKADGQVDERILKSLGARLDQVRSMDDAQWQRAKRMIAMRLMGGGPGRGQRQGYGPGRGQGYGPGQGQGRMGAGAGSEQQVKAVIGLLEKARRMSDSDYRAHRSEFVKALAKLVVSANRQRAPQMAAHVILRCPQSARIIKRMIEQPKPLQAQTRQS